jgi:DNA polymerase-3 subunit epsilon
MFEDMNGIKRLAIEKRKRNLEPLYTFSLLVEGQSMLRKLIHEFNLCPKLCFLQTDDERCEGVKEKYCFGACEHNESVTDYNNRVMLAIESLKNRLPSFTLIGEGRTRTEQSCILIERGKFYGMGYLPTDADAIVEIDQLKNYLTAYPENDYMRGLVYQHANRWPNRKIDISVAQ